MHDSGVAVSTIYPIRHVTCSPLPLGMPPWNATIVSKGYQVRVACPCGVVFERWVLPQDAEEDLLGSELPAFPS